MAVKFKLRQSFTVPVTSGQYAPERIQLNAGSAGLISAPALLGVTALVEQAVASAIVELWLLGLQAGLDPTQDASYFYAGKSTATGDTFPLASWPGAQLRVKSGGTAGTQIVNATADE